MKTAATQNRTLIVYGVIILLLFLVMVPYRGWLEAEKTRRDLGEATIGQVDAGSFMLKLALLGGARGVAANVLWTRAIDLQKAQEWDRLKAVVDLITELQPHFLAVWTFQSWNLSYNVAAEWDAPEDKYEWIKQGIKFAQKGVEKNRRSPDLIWDVASYYYHKLGFADEAIILRRLFRDDDDEKFKTDPMEGSPRNDNFQVAFGWFTRAVDMVDRGQTRLGSDIETKVSYIDPPTQRKGRPGDLAFRSMPAHAQTRYAANLEKQSMMGIPATFGQVASREWQKALDEWVKFGRYKYETPNEIERDGKLVHDVIYIDDATVPERLKKLNDNQAYWTNRWADQMNYPYWKDRSTAETEMKAVEARQLFYEGTKAFKGGDFPEAGKKFKEGLALWEKVLARHAVYRRDDMNAKDTGLILKRYLRVLANLNEPTPENLPFQDLLKETEQDIPRDPFDELEMPVRAGGK